MKIEPSLSASRFSKADPGSLVQIEGKRGIIAIDSTPPVEKVVAMYDVARSRFERRGADDAALLIFHGEIVLRPTLLSAFDGHPSATSTNEIYLVDDRPHVVLHANAGFRLLDLSTGKTESTQRSSLMTGFREWEICARLGNGELMTLIRFSPHNSSEAAVKAVSGHMGR